jgi:CheY-like chemotaxis protein
MKSRTRLTIFVFSIVLFAVESGAAKECRNKILIVDDNRDDIELARYVLLKLGCSSLVTAVSAEEGLNILIQSYPQQPVALIISDYHMGNPDGIEFLRILRADKRFREVPFAIFSSDDRGRELVEPSLKLSRWFPKDMGLVAFEQRMLELLESVHLRTESCESPVLRASLPASQAQNHTSF